MFGRKTGLGNGLESETLDPDSGPFGVFAVATTPFVCGNDRGFAGQHAGTALLFLNGWWEGFSMGDGDGANLLLKSPFMGDGCVGAGRSQRGILLRLGHSP